METTTRVIGTEIIRKESVKKIVLKKDAGSIGTRDPQTRKKYS